MSHKVTIIDPPLGWRYGFPRVFNKAPDQSVADWLIEVGYPPENAEWAAAHCWYFERELEET